MANMYSEMGRFLQESFNIENTFKKSAKRSLKESLKEDFADARPASTKISNFIEMGADPAAILDELLRFLPDSALADFADYYGENFLGIGDDWE